MAEEGKVLDTAKTADNAEGKSCSLSLMEKPEKVIEFKVRASYFQYLGKLRHLKPDKMWISAAGGGTKLVLVDRQGKVLRNIDTGCQMYHTLGLYCTNDGELIFCDNTGKRVTKLSPDFSVTTLFMTGKSGPRGISQLQSGDWVVCIADEGVLRVYDGTGNVVREIGKGLLQDPYHVTVNKLNDDICVSDNTKQVVVLSSSGEKRFTYTGDGSGFSAWDLCCDQLGNILIIDYENHRVHIIDSDGHFLRYLVSGDENISYPMTIDIDDMGYAWVGELGTRNVKAFKYLE